MSKSEEVEKNERKEELFAKKLIMNIFPNKSRANLARLLLVY